MSRPLSRRGFLLGAGAATAGAVLVPDLRALLAPEAVPTTYKHFPALGTRVSIAVRHPDTRLARVGIRAAIRAVFEVHQTMTLHEPSPLTLLNDRAGPHAQVVPDSLWQVLQASGRLYAQTGGLFDASLGRWASVELETERQAVRLHQPDMGIDLNGIAKGYAVDCAAAALRQAGLVHFLVNAGGDLYAAGCESEASEGWVIHLHAGTPQAVPLRSFTISNQAVATSGNTVRPAGPDGQPTPHLKHPSLGWPAAAPLLATAIAPTAMAADAWSTAAFVGAPTELAQRRSSVAGVALYRAEVDGRILPI